MKVRLATLAIVALLVGVFIAAPAGAAKPGTGSVTQAVTGTTTGGGTFAGNYDINRFAVQNGQLVAIGTLTGTLTDAAGNLIGNVTDVPVTIPVTDATGACPILDLTLGPLHLNLLGLTVDLNQVVLHIAAQPGAGNLLGNLLCAVANLLNNPSGQMNGVANLLNHILQLL